MPPSLASEGVSRPGFRTSEGWCAELLRGIAELFSPDYRPSGLLRERPSQASALSVRGAKLLC
eukprot:5277023-Alexandrium_andersonii.AAC.1